ncbi:MAG: FAD:protein FMN transferase [Muribaculaceae bacterium]|nr:FAD:protein FMN transferase [Muribaculaceae bacterium]
MKRFRHSSIFIIITLFSLVVISSFSGCIKDKTWQKSEGMIWNTIWHATYHGDSADIAAAIDSLKEAEKSLSIFDDRSLICYINKNESGPIDHHLLRVYEMSLKVNKMSKGLFDPTLSPLIEAWGFGENHTPTADTALIANLLPSVGIDKTKVENGMLIKSTPEMAFNFSAIAKGYGVDLAAKALEDKGCHDLMFEIGGEVVCRGHNPEGKKWRILIELPDEEYLKEVFKNEKKPTFKDRLVVELNDEALATSGNYRNYHSESGQTYGHTISAKTGRPVKTDILSASVIAPTCMEADALATACMVMGSSDAMVMLLEEDLAGAFILYSGEVLINEKMKEHLAKNL